MTPKIKVKKDYILVESLAGLETLEILKTVTDLFNLNEFKNRNVIWSFSEGPILLVPDDFDRIFKLIETKYHFSKNGKKAAMIAETPFIKGLVDKFIRQYRNRLPFKIKGFSDFQAAKNWISG